MVRSVGLCIALASVAVHGLRAYMWLCTLKCTDGLFPTSSYRRNCGGAPRTQSGTTKPKRSVKTESGNERSVRRNARKRRKRRRNGRRREKGNGSVRESGSVKGRETASERGTGTGTETAIGTATDGADAAAPTADTPAEHQTAGGVAHETANAPGARTATANAAGITATWHTTSTSGCTGTVEYFVRFSSFNSVVR